MLTVLTLGTILKAVAHLSLVLFLEGSVTDGGTVGCRPRRCMVLWKSELTMLASVLCCILLLKCRLRIPVGIPFGWKFPSCIAWESLRTCVCMWSLTRLDGRWIATWCLRVFAPLSRTRTD